MLAFNPELQEIAIRRQDGETRLVRREHREMDQSITLVKVAQEVNGVETTSWQVALARNESICSGVLLGAGNDGHLSLLQESGIPKFFLAFPLFGTEDFCFPGVVNSRSFVPTEDRDGIFLALGMTKPIQETRD